MSSLEMLAQNWNLINQKKYFHRIKSYKTSNELDQATKLIPRKINQGEIFDLKTLLLTRSRPFMEANNKDKVFVGQEYFYHASKL